MSQMIRFCLRTSFAITLSAVAIGCGGDGGSTGATSTGGAGSSGLQTTGGGSSVSNENGGVASTGGARNVGGSSSTTPVNSTCDPSASDGSCFSFFVASRARLFALAEAFGVGTSGWGGDFRYGTGDGLTGADKICTEIAEQSLPGNGKTWKAFLSTSQVNAIDRVGSGPWYDRLNRTIANSKTELVATRPGGITNSTILNNLPNEDGTPHHNEENNTQGQQADNHDILTGSDSEGKVCNSSACWNSGVMGGGMGGGGTITNATCGDWTLAVKQTGYQPRVGHTWPTMTNGTDDWISWLNEGGCLPGYNLIQNGGPSASAGSVGSGGGYGAIYCLAMSP